MIAYRKLFEEIEHVDINMRLGSYKEKLLKELESIHILNFEFWTRLISFLCWLNVESVLALYSVANIAKNHLGIN